MSTTIANLEPPMDAAQAFAAVKPEIDAIPDDETVPLNVDLEYAASTALGAANRMLELLDGFRSLPGIDPDAPIQLRKYALAALYSCVASTTPPEDLRYAEVLEEATNLREDLLQTAELCARFGLLSADRVAEIRAGSGHLDTASDLIALRELFTAHWPVLQGKVPCSRDDVERAGVLGVALHELIAARRAHAGDRPRRDSPGRVGARAFTLLLRKYDVCRAAVAFLRREHGDADAFTPSLYIRRRRRPPTSREEPTIVDAPPTVPSKIEIV